jgi:hypothetical protein
MDSCWGTTKRSSVTSDLPENPTEDFSIANLDRYLQIILLSTQKLKSRTNSNRQKMLTNTTGDLMSLCLRTRQVIR